MAKIEKGYQALNLMIMGIEISSKTFERLRKEGVPLKTELKREKDFISSYIEIYGQRKIYYPSRKEALRLAAMGIPEAI